MCLFESHELFTNFSVGNAVMCSHYALHSYVTSLSKIFDVSVLRQACPDEPAAPSTRLVYELWSHSSALQTQLPLLRGIASVRKMAPIQSKTVLSSTVLCFLIRQWSVFSMHSRSTYNYLIVRSCYCDYEGVMLHMYNYVFDEIKRCYWQLMSRS